MIAVEIERRENGRQHLFQRGKAVVPARDNRIAGYIIYDIGMVQSFKPVHVHSRQGAIISVDYLVAGCQNSLLTAELT